MSTIFLYIKQHQITKLLYFGKTAVYNPEVYLGSGKYWKRHIKQHGKFIDTLCIWEFDNQEECTQFALKFSKENNIVISDRWANLNEENGIDGAPLGYKQSETHRKHNSESKIGRKSWNKGQTGIYTKETLEKMGKHTKKKSSAEIKEIRSLGNIKRWKKLKEKAKDDPTFKYFKTDFHKKGKDSHLSKKVKYKELIFYTLEDCKKYTNKSRYYLLNDPHFSYL